MFCFAEDIQIRFFEENKHEGLVWEAFGHFGPQDVHRQVIDLSVITEFNKTVYHIIDFIRT